MIIDTDVGYDDLLAILYLLSTGAQIEAFTVVGGISDVQEGADALLRMQEMLNLQPPIPVFLGESVDPNPLPADWRHQATKLGWGPPTTLTPERIPAADFLARQLKAGTVRLLAIGPLTNIAAALRSVPNGLLGSTIMGGAFNVPGNVPEVNPVAEANMFVDPPAAGTVFTYYGPGSFLATVVPLDACNQVPIDTSFVLSFAFSGGVSPAFILATQILLQIQAEFLVNGEPYFAFDPLAAVSIGDPAVLQNLPSGTVQIGPQGQTTFNPGGSVFVALSAYPQAFQTDFFAAFGVQSKAETAGS
jgi:purine nucleosidase